MPFDPTSPSDLPPETPDDGRLSSWKGIAAHFGCDVRTVQRWERREGLPVHRHVHDKLATIYAYPSELDAWRASRRPSARQEEDELGRGVVGEEPMDALAPAAPPEARSTWSRGRIAAVLGGVLVGAILLLAVGWSVRRWTHSTSRRPIEAIAVLPFQNLSGDPTQEYIADGVTEAVITSVARAPDLRVTARTSVMRYKSTTEPASAIARRLDVDALVEGSVVRSGERLRVFVRLVDAATERHVWSRTFERDLEDVLLLHDEIGASLATELRTAVSPPTPRGPLAMEAHDAYLRGRYLWNRRAGEGAQEQLRRAIAVEPTFAEAHAALAETFAGANPEERKEGLAAARRALELDDGLSSAHAALGALLLADFDWRGADDELRRAIALNPSDVSARLFHGQTFLAVGCIDAAIEETRRARQLDPISPVTGQAMGAVLFHARRYGEAIPVLEETLALDPNLIWTRIRLAQCRVLAGDATPPRELVEDEAARARMAQLFVATGRRQEAEEIAKSLPDVSNYDRAVLRAALGEVDGAFADLEEQWAARDMNMTMVGVDPRLDPIRADARFSNLLGRMGLLPQPIACPGS